MESVSAVEHWVWIPAFAGMTRLILVVFAILLLSTTKTHAGEIRLYTAASTAPLMEHLKPVFETETGDELLIVPASSAVLARQIDAGADADLFLSANRAWADYIAERQDVTTDNHVTILGNALVLAVPQDTAVSDAPLTKAGFEPLVHDRPLAICDPDSVPCGIYAKQALETLGLWDVAQDAKIIRGANALATITKFYTHGSESVRTAGCRRL